MTRAEQIKKELTTLPPPIPGNSLDPLFSAPLQNRSVVQLVSEALNQDLRGNLGTALEAYKTALNQLMTIMKSSTNAALKSIVVAQLKMYMNRAEQLKSWLRERGRSP